MSAIVCLRPFLRGKEMFLRVNHMYVLCQSSEGLIHLSLFYEVHNLYQSTLYFSTMMHTIIKSQEY
jgi:hypothetical protein